MKNFWPKLSSPKGFSIEKIAIDYRNKLKEKIEKDADNLKTGIISFEKNKDSRKLIGSFKKSDVALLHWANRDFNEYLDIA